MRMNGVFLNLTQKKTKKRSAGAGIISENSGRKRCQEKILDIFSVIRYDTQGGQQMEKFVEQTLLYDFYGELLTERQQQIYESVVLEDYSLSEVAEELGISRQGVHDMIKRCNHTLEEYEGKLHLVEKFIRIRDQIRRIRRLAEECQAREITDISNEILEEL